MPDRSFFYLTLTFLKWVVVPYKRVLAISPYCLVGSAVSALVSQMAMVVSFFLPLKVVFLLNADEVPSYIAHVFPGVTLGELLAILVAVSIGSYFVFLAANRYAETLSSRGGNEVVASSSKLTLFSDQDEVARRAYHRFGSLLAGLFFLVVSLLLFWFFYHALFWIVALLLVACFLFVALAFRVSDRVVESFSTSLHSSVSQVYGVLFLFVFGLMVLHIIYLGEVNVYLSLVAVLLVRQLFQRLTNSTLDAVLLFRQKEKINALFLRDHAPVTSLNSREEPFVEVIGSAESFFWTSTLDDVMKAHGALGTGEGVPRVVFLQSSIVDIVLFLIVYDSKRFLLKLYAGRHHLLSVRECDLLTGHEETLPSLDLLFVSEVRGFKAHFYTIPEGAEVPSFVEFKERRDLFRRESFSCLPDDEILKKYFRSHLLLPDRVKGWYSALSLNVFSSSLEGWEASDFIAHVVAVLVDLPLHYVTPDVTNDSLVTVGDEVVCLHWERWSIEPVGFGLSVPELEVGHLQKVLSSSRHNDIDWHAVRLCGLISVIETHINNQKFKMASDFVVLARQCLEEIMGKKGSSAK
ncbi:hypothetical protein [Halomonas caseinilytica]|uniref:Uncharacterized protein n=1 Tax=Halomonas caseinilytica TaxID=438744 RepID=A0A1M6RHT7_9GAMM|nr:hypothetical protein [Halomonas caseinilytica]SHK31999.1 hypothetical protein SAMN05192556_102326 [Halomonas caseinilytica]